MVRKIAVCLLWSIALTSQAATIEPDDLEAFADGVIEATMENENVAGTVLGVVVDGEVALLKGYGYSDVESGEVVDPDKTLFRPGSVTKLFTWVALMQLRDAGKLDFDTDINEYLEGVEVPATYDEPVTIKHLMTHTPGFEDHVEGLFGRDASSLKPLPQLLREEMPQRVRPPGKLASYSNHGVAMAGLIVEQVSGIPWAEYIERSILEPLDMAYTTMRQPLPERLAPHMSKGYAFEAGRYVEKDFEFVPAAPAGSASASGGDMVRLIRAFLDGGGPVLSTSSASEMRDVLHRANESAGGLLHGFYETSSHGQFMMGHGGDTIWFHSELVLMPDQDIGWFISTNSAAGPAVRSSFHREFLDRYFSRTEVEPIEMTAQELARFAGFYGPLRHSHDDLSKIGKLVGALAIQPAPEGGELLAVVGGEVQRVEPIGPTTFKNERSETIVSFDVDDNGNATHLHVSNAPIVAFEKMSGLQSPTLHRSILGLTGIVFAWVLIAWSIQRYYRRFVLPGSVARFRLAAWWMALSVAVFGILVATVLADINAIVFGMSTGMEVAFMLPWLTLALALLTVILLPAVLREPTTGRMGKVGYALVTLTGLAFGWFLFYWQAL